MSAGNAVQQEQSGRLLECVEELPDTLVREPAGKDMHWTCLWTENWGVM